MKLLIHHEFTRVFDPPATMSVQYLRVWPRIDPGQRMVRWQIVVNGSLMPWHDGFGNLVYCSVINEPHDKLSFAVKGQVEIQDLGGIIPLEDNADLLPMYLRASRATEIDGPLASLADRIGNFGSDANAQFSAILDMVAEKVEYRMDAEAEALNAQMALEQGTAGIGSASLANLTVALARAKNIPARAVSGLFATGQQENGHDLVKPHCWLEVYIENVGWVGHDPSHRCRPDDRYLRFALGFDHEQTLPLRGLRTTAPGEWK